MCAAWEVVVPKAANAIVTITSSAVRITGTSCRDCQFVHFRESRFCKFVGKALDELSLSSFTLQLLKSFFV